MHDYRDSIFARALISVLRRRRFLGILFVLVTALAVVLAWTARKHYTTGATLQVQSKEAKGGLASLTKGLGMLDPMKQNSGTATIMAIFESRELAVTMIRKFNLMNKYHTKWEHFAIRKFESNLQVSSYADNIISVTFTYDSQDSVKLITDSILAYVDAKNRQLATSKGTSDYIFLSGQLNKIQSDVATVADSMITLMRKYNIADFENQSKLGLEQIGNMEEEITKLTSRKAMMETENSGSPVQIGQIRSAITSLRERQRALIEGSSIGTGASKFSFIAPYAALPELQKKFKLYEMELEKNEAYLKMLLPSLQEARVEMVENVPTLTFIDPTYRPPYKSGPRRVLTLLLIVAPTMLFACLFFIMKDFISSPEHSDDSGRDFLRYVRSRSK